MVGMVNRAPVGSLSILPQGREGTCPVQSGPRLVGRTLAQSTCRP